MSFDRAQARYDAMMPREYDGDDDPPPDRTSLAWLRAERERLRVAVACCEVGAEDELDEVEALIEEFDEDADDAPSGIGGG